mgnify:FL=1|tara:strand:+ start:528 stop:1004 length:477 start_codon:yes stop_codon:yes gene_type:complete
MKSILNTFYKTADFKSRSSKKEMILFILFIILLFIIVVGLEFWRVGSESEKSRMTSLVIQDKLFIVFLICLIPLLTLSIRRLHDVNMSGAYIGIPVIIDIGLRFAGYANSPIENGVRIIILAFLIFLCFKNSYPKDNDHGKYVSTIKKKSEDIIRSDS